MPSLVLDRPVHEALRDNLTQSRLQTATKQQESSLDLGPPAPGPAILPLSHYSALSEAPEMSVE